MRAALDAVTVILISFQTAKAFLPSMMAKNHGHIVSIASSAGLAGIAGLSDYCSSKFAAVGFNESLQMELVATGKTAVHTSLVCPYIINTGMFDGAKSRWVFYGRRSNFCLKGGETEFSRMGGRQPLLF